MKKLIYLLIVAFLLLPSLALSLTIDSVANFNVSKSMLAGMRVYIDSGSGFGSANTWIYNSSTGFSGFTDSGWSIQFTGNFTGDSGFKWLLTSTSTSIKGIKIDAYGDTNTGAHNFFDIVYDPGNEYTPGSSQGLWYPNDPWYNGGTQGIKNSSGTVTSSNPEPDPSLYIDQGSIAYNWSFSDPVGLTGDSNSPYGDLYTTLKIDFTNALSGGTNPTTFAFGVDTDMEAPVPEPATLFMLGLGLLGLCGVMKKKINTV